MQVRTDLGSLLKVAMVADAVTALTAWSSKPFPRGIPAADLSCRSSQPDVLIEIIIVDITVPSGKLWRCKSKQVSCPSTSSGRSRASREGLGPELGSRYLGRYQSP